MEWTFVRQNFYQVFNSRSGCVNVMRLPWSILIWPEGQPFNNIEEKILFGLMRRYLFNTVQQYGSFFKS